MKTLTKILPQKHCKQRVDIYLDDEYFSSLEKITALSYNLEVGMEISESKLFEIVDESEYTSAFDRASKYIAGAQHTKMQVIIYLKDKNYSGKIIARVIDKLEEYGYIDDYGFAKSFVEVKRLTHGKKLIECELKQKGVPEEIIDKVLYEMSDEDESCYNIAKKYLKNKNFDYEIKVKCFRFCMSKGFSYEAITCALDRLERELSEN